MACHAKANQNVSRIAALPHLRTLVHATDIYPVWHYWVALASWDILPKVSHRRPRRRPLALWQKCRQVVLNWRLRHVPVSKGNGVWDASNGGVTFGEWPSWRVATDQLWLTDFRQYLLRTADYFRNGDARRLDQTHVQHNGCYVYVYGSGYLLRTSDSVLVLSIEHYFGCACWNGQQGINTWRAESSRKESRNR